MMNKSNWIVLAALGVVMASPEGVRAQQTDSTAAQASPTPAQQLSGPPPAAAPMRRVRRSWTSDNKPLEIGDIITILIDEYTLATADLQDLRDKDRDRDLSLALGLGGTSMRAAFSLGNDASERSRGEAARRERFTAEITARVTETVQRVIFVDGGTVKAGDVLIVLEAMKMENEIQADVAGVVKQIFVEEGQSVEGGDVLFEIASV